MYDIYHRQEIIKAGRIPEELIINNTAFVPEMMGVEPPRGIYSPHHRHRHRAHRRERVLRAGGQHAHAVRRLLHAGEPRSDDAHVPRPVRQATACAPVENYPENLRRRRWRASRPQGLDREPTIALLTPGIYNSAYFEHSFLADQMGVELVEGQDLIVVDGTAADEDDAGPEARSTSSTAASTTTSSIRSSSSRIRCWACRACSIVYRAGRRDDRQRAGRRHRRRQGDLHLHARDHRVLHRPARRSCKNVPTYNCRKPDDLAYVLEHLAELVVKEVHGSGGYGMLVGPTATKRRDRGLFAPSSRRGPTTTSRSRRWRSRPARRWSRRASRRATSTCAPLCWSATRCASRPAA